MALDRTSGFDMLVQISENEISEQIGIAFVNGELFEENPITVPINFPGVTGELELNLEKPSVDLDRPRPRMGFTIPFESSQLTITAPITANIAPLGGTIVVVDAVQIRSTPGFQQVVVDFTDGAPVVTFTFDAASAALLTPILADFGITLAMAQNFLAAAVTAFLVSDVRRALANIRGLGFANERSRIDNDIPLRGEGIAAAARAALAEAGSKMHDIDFRLSDAAGEGFHFKEQSLLMSKLLRERKTELPLWLAADTLGDTGAAAGLCSIAWAIAGWTHRYAPGPRALACAGNEGGARAAIVLENMQRERTHG
jgi:hypothetical protein